MAAPAVLVTGGAVRIGAAIVRRFSQSGWHVIIHHRGTDDEADEFASLLPSAETVACDLEDGDAAVAMVEKLASRQTNWRALINSAAVFHYDSVTALDPQTNKQAMQINAETPARIAQAYLQSAKAEGARCVVQLTDQKIVNSNPDFFSYTMSKHALAATIPMLAIHHRASGDKIYGLAPGAILASHDQTEAETDLSHRLNPLKRKTGADEIADAALFLASGHMRSGETLFIDSGQHLLSQDRDVIYLARELAERAASQTSP